MPTYGSLDCDRYTFIGTNGQEITIKDVSIAERSRFIMWFSRLKILWAAFKTEYPNATLQQAYDETTIDKAGQCILNSRHYSVLRWTVDHLLTLAGVPLGSVSIDIVYALFLEYKGEGSVFEQLWLNHPDIDTGDDEAKPLPDRVDQAENLIAELLSAGHAPADIAYCIEQMPQRELQTALRLANAKATERVKEIKKPKPSPQGGNIDDDVLKAAYAESIPELELRKNVEAFKAHMQGEWGNE